MKSILLFSSLLAVSLASVCGQDSGTLVPLKTELPKPIAIGTPAPISLENLEPPKKEKRPDFLVPAGSTNLAEGKPVTSSDSEPLLGELSMITDGVKDGDEGNYVELGNGKQWVQVDLGKSATINAVLVWHFHSQARAYRNVVMQVSDDPEFVKDTTTIFNSDTKGSLGLGNGTDQAYVENYEGRLVDARGAKGRYVRLYSEGNTTNDANHYIEVEVWGK